MKHFGYIIGLVILLSACDSSVEESESTDTELYSSINKLETELFGSTQGKIDRKKAIELIDLYSEYAASNPEDTLSPEYLYKASDISMNIRRPVQTIELLISCLQNILTTKNHLPSCFLRPLYMKTR